MSRTDLAELWRLWEAATKGENWQEAAMFNEACKLALPALLDELEAMREALSQIYWKSIELGEDRGDSTINHIAADALRGDTSPRHARDRRMKLIGAALLREVADGVNKIAVVGAIDTPQSIRDLIADAIRAKADRIAKEAPHA